LGTPARSIRDYDESQREIKKENFNLKLRIFFLEERLALGRENSNEKLISSNIDLKVQLESCKQELSEKLSLLVEASEALEHLDTQIKNESQEKKREVEALEQRCQGLEAFSSKPSNCIENRSHIRPASQSQRYLQKSKSGDLEENGYVSTETMVLEVLEELEEFSEREKDFENKYNKEIIQLKQSSMKTEADLEKIQQKLAEYEDEIESLNSNLDAKNEFIAALQNNMEEKNSEAEYLEMQLEKSSEVIKGQEEEIKSIKRRPQTEMKKLVRTNRMMKNSGMNTETNNFMEIIKLLEDEILFKNQEINEFQSEIKIRDSKIYNLEQASKCLMSDEDFKKTGSQIGLMEKIQMLETDNKKLDDQLKLHIHERKLLLKKISMLKDQKCSNQMEDLENIHERKEMMDAAQQCDFDESSVTLEAYKQNLVRFRGSMLALKKKLASSIESLQEFRKSHEKFVHMVEVIVNMDDINIRDEISNLVNDTKKISEIPNENEKMQLEELDPMSTSNSSFSSDSYENIQNFQTNILQYLEKESKEQKKSMKKNCSIIFQLEDELLIRDALTDGQVEIINDLKTNLKKLQNKNFVEKEGNESNDDSDSWYDADKVISFERIGLPPEYMQKSDGFAEKNTTSGSENDDYNQDIECLDENCLAKEKDFLIDLLDLLCEEIDSCENIDSGVELDFEMSQTKMGENLWKLCQHCSTGIQKDMHELLRKLHYGLPGALDQVKKLKYFYENLCKNSRKECSESERNKQTLNDYHVLIAKLTSENLKMTGEKLVTKSEIQEIQKRNSQIIHELEEEICCLNSQLADKEVEELKTKSSPSPRSSQQDRFIGRGPRENNANDFLSSPTSDSLEFGRSPELTQELSTRDKQKFSSKCHIPTKSSNRSQHFDVRNWIDSECSSDSENCENEKGVSFNKYKVLEKNREILDNKMIRNFPKKISSKPIRKNSRVLRRSSDS